MGQLLRNDLADILKRRFRDPRVNTTHLCVEEMRVTRDLSYAHVYVSSLVTTTAEEQKDLEKILNRAKGFLRSELAKRNTFRTTPELVFHFDKTRETAERMDGLIAEALERETDGS